MVVASDPMYQPTETEASPRVRTAFSEVRQRQLPDIARTRYASAKASFDKKDYPSAEHQFRELLRLIDDPDMGGRLGDLRMLVTGFVDLSAAAAAPPPEPRPEPRREEVAPPPPATAVPDRRRSTPRRTRAFRLRRRFGRKYRASRCRSPIRPASVASST